MFIWERARSFLDFINAATPTPLVAHFTRHEVGDLIDSDQAIRARLRQSHHDRIPTCSRIRGVLWATKFLATADRLHEGARSRYLPLFNRNFHHPPITAEHLTKGIPILHCPCRLSNTLPRTFAILLDTEDPTGHCTRPFIWIATAGNRHHVFAGAHPNRRMAATPTKADHFHGFLLRKHQPALSIYN
jgi:hypothetical protein